MKSTKEKLLENATQMFAEHGFDGVSTRSLVAMSMVNLCTINYYFGSKQKLYDAVIDNIMNNVKENLIKQIKEHMVKDISSMDKITLIVGEFFDYLFSDNISNSMALILLREFFASTDSGDRMYNETMKPLKKNIVKLIVGETKVDNKTAYILAESLISPAMVFRLLQNREHYSRDFLKKAKQQLIANCKLLLNNIKK